ncbi:MAG: succinate dehydrogenase assembly factor 2 [Limnobacter sp.]|nr:succinate dehydrogenase assembly factor 2 [Limnobacter sp.]
MAPDSSTGPEAGGPAQPGSHQSDAARRRRLRWRARRGLLENDLIFERFFDRFESTLDDDEVAGLHELLDLPDNELLDLILRRKEPGPDVSPQARRVLETLRSV